MKMPPVMKAQAILTSLHFVRAELVIAVDLYQEKIHHNDRQDIEVLLFIVLKIKLKFLFSLSTRVHDKRKSFLDIFSVQNGWRLERTKGKPYRSIIVLLLLLLATKLKCRSSTKR